MRPRSGFSLIRPIGLLAAIFLACFAGFGPSVLANDTPGNNGTVKIHEGNTEKEPGEVRNEPHVCTFHLHFYFADPEQAGTWEIQQWAPTGTKGTVVLSGTYDTHGDGEDRQPPAPDVYTLPDGHYKLFWDGDLDTGKHDKMKVFWVDCPAPAQTPTPGGTQQPVGSAPASTPPSASTSPSGSDLPTAGSPSPAGSEQPIGGIGSSPSATPTGEVEGIAGTPPAGTPVTGEVLGIQGGPAATPPPTDAAPARTATDDGWRAVVFVLAALTAASVLLLPARRKLGTRPVRTSGTDSRRG
jgi:hypothetical protein